MKRYRLLKDLPGSKAGAVFHSMGGANGNFYIQETGYIPPEEVKSLIFSTECFGRPVVERNPDWFEEVKEEPKEAWGDRLWKERLGLAK